MHFPFTAYNRIYNLFNENGIRDESWLLAKHGTLSRKLSPSWSFPRTTNFEMQSVQQGNPDAGYWQWTWISRWVERKGEICILTVHPDCAADNVVLLYLTHHTARDYVARAPDRGDLTDDVKCGMTDGRDSISRGVPTGFLAEKISRWIARDVRELKYTCVDGRAWATANASWSLREDGEITLYYNFVYIRGMFARGF